MKRLRVFIIPVAVAFAAGVLVRDVAQDQRDKEQAKALQEQVRHCMYYVVVNARGELECRALMPIFRIDHPLKRAAR